METKGESVRHVALEMTRLSVVWRASDVELDVAGAFRTSDNIWCVQNFRRTLAGRS